MKTVSIVATLLVCLVIYPEQTTSDSCGPHQVYKECGSACPERCDNSGPQACIALCVEGCFCKDGYVLISRNINLCIPREDCPT